MLYNRTAEVAGEYLRKGSKVYLEGSLRTRKWQDKSGMDKYTTEIIANDLQMLDGRRDGDFNQAPQSSGYSNKPNNTAATSTANTVDDSFDDDIPF